MHLNNRESFNATSHGGVCNWHGHSIAIIEAVYQNGSPVHTRHQTHSLHPIRSCSRFILLWTRGSTVLQSAWGRWLRLWSLKTTCTGTAQFPQFVRVRLGVSWGCGMAHWLLVVDRRYAFKFNMERWASAAKQTHFGLEILSWSVVWISFQLRIRRR